MFAWQATVQDESGNAIPLPVVTVWLEDGVTLADIFDEAGNALPNPMTGTMEGFVQFWANAGEYKIEGASGGDETEIWTVNLGSANIVKDAAAFFALTHTPVGRYSSQDGLCWDVVAPGDGDFDHPVTGDGVIVSKVGGCIALESFPVSEGDADFDNSPAIRQWVNACLSRGANGTVGDGEFFFKQSGVFSDLTSAPVYGTVFRGAGMYRTRFTLVTEDEERWFYNAESPSASQRVAAIVFEDMGFESDSGVFGNFWNEYSTGSYGKFQKFHRCHFTNFNTSFRFMGSANADEFQWDNCRWVRCYGPALDIRNTQSVIHRLHSCDLEGMRGSSIFRLYDSALVDVNGGSIIWGTADDGAAEDQALIEIGPGVAFGNSNFTMRAVKTEMRSARAKILRMLDPGSTQSREVRIQFDNCDFGIVFGAPRVAVSALMRTTVIFRGGQYNVKLLPEGIANANWSTRSNLARVSWTDVAFIDNDTDYVGLPTDIVEGAVFTRYNGSTAAPSDQYAAPSLMLTAEGCWGSYIAAETYAVADFVFGTLTNGGTQAQGPQYRDFAIKRAGKVWPRPDTGLEIALRCYPGMLIESITVFKPSTPTGGTVPYTLKLGRDDKSVVYWEHTFPNRQDVYTILNDPVLRMVETSGNIRLWAEGEGVFTNIHQGFVSLKYTG